MNKLFDLINLFRKGVEISNKEAWKDGGNAATLLVPILVLLAKLAGDFGYSIELTAEQAALIAAGIVTFVQFVIHNITSKHAGLMPAKTNDAGDSNKQSAQELPAAKVDETVRVVPLSTVRQDDTYFG